MCLQNFDLTPFSQERLGLSQFLNSQLGVRINFIQSINSSPIFPSLRSDSDISVHRNLCSVTRPGICPSPCKHSNRSANRIFWKVLQTSGFSAPAAPHSNGILETLRWSHKHICSPPSPLQHLCKDRLIHFPPQDSNFRCIELHDWPPVLRFPILAVYKSNGWFDPPSRSKTDTAVARSHFSETATPGAGWGYGSGLKMMTSRGIIAIIIQLIIHAPMMTKWLFTGLIVSGPVENDVASASIWKQNNAKTQKSTSTWHQQSDQRIQGINVAPQQSWTAPIYSSSLAPPPASAGHALVFTTRPKIRATPLPTLSA